ncbi:MAG: toxin-antitoxin system YwqK family antitoxin [Flavobacteriales bacterium]
MYTLLRTFLPGLPLLLAASVLAQPPASINQKDAKGLKQGRWERTWADRQQLRYEGQFKDDKPVGRFTYYSVAGKVESVVDHYPGSTASHAHHFHPNGKVMADGRYVGEDKDSTWNYYDEAGRLRSTEHWKAGKKNGEQTQFYDDGKVAERLFFADGVQHGKAEQFLPDGKPKYTANFVKGEPEGTLTWYFPNGRKEIEGGTVNGDRDGSWYYYNEDGTVQIQVLYRKGEYVKDKKENGTFNEYYDDERPKGTVTYRKGLKEGPFTEYYNNGRWVTRPVKLGPEGMEKADTERVIEGQTKKREGTYKNDQLDGVVKEYDEKGRLVKSTTYTNGQATTP